RVSRKAMPMSSRWRYRCGSGWRIGCGWSRSSVSASGPGTTSVRGRSATRMRRTISPLTTAVAALNTDTTSSSGIDGFTSRAGVTERNDDAAAIGEDLARVQVRRRDDRLPCPERIRQRAAGDLVRIEVGRDVDVRRQQVVDDLPLREVLVHELHVVRDTEALRDLDERVAVRLAGLLQELGVRLTDDEIERAGMRRDDLGHRLDDVLETLAGVHEPEGRHDLASLDAELPLEAPAAVRLDRGHAVLDDDRFFRDAVD